MHAIGDAAVRAGLDAVRRAAEVNGPRDRRHQLAHLLLVDPDDLSRFRELGVIADVQGSWAIPDTFNQDLNLPTLGPERYERNLPDRGPGRERSARGRGGATGPPAT